MLRSIGFSLLLSLVFMPTLSAIAAEMSADAAWKALPTYQYGQDMSALLTMDREVIKAMATPATRAVFAARLAALLDAPNTTSAAKQYICCQLRQVGTSAEVAILSRMLAKPETAQMARYALESIPGEQSLAALRAALDTLHGDLLIGTINSVAVRKDVSSVAKLKDLASDKDAKIAAAALWALSNIANSEAIAFVEQQAAKAADPISVSVAIPLLRCAESLAVAGKAEESQAIYARLSEPGQPVGVRRAAFVVMLKSQKDRATETILAWISSDDADRRVVAAERLAALSDAELDRLAAKLFDLPGASQAGLLEVLAMRKGKAILPMVLSAVRSENRDTQLAGVRLLGQIGDASNIALLTDLMAKGGKIAGAAQKSLERLPRDTVVKAMMAALAERPEIRNSVLAVLTDLRCYEAIDPILVIAAQKDPKVYGPALTALQGIADPDETDIPRFVKLLLTVDGQQREAVERTIFLVCERTPDAANRVKPVMAALAKVDAAELPKYLPLLGRFGGGDVMKMIDAASTSEKPEVKAAAIRALCNWPTAEVADRLWTLAGSDDPQSREWAFHAYVRVVTLKSDRPEAETLALLQKAMKAAKNAEEQQWVLQRASTVRTLDAVKWISGYLDDPNLGQTACRSIVDLAHHRFLRHPNMDVFKPMLEKVGSISKDPSVVARARKYRLGL